MPKEKEPEAYESVYDKRSERKTPFAQDLFEIPREATRGILDPEPTAEEKRTHQIRAFRHSVIETASAMQAINDSTWGVVLQHMNELTQAINDETLKNGLTIIAVSRTMARAAQIDVTSDILLKNLEKEAKEAGIELPPTNLNDGLLKTLGRLQDIVTQRLVPTPPI